MQAAVLEKPGTIHIQQVDKPAPAAGEVLIKVTLAGICGSDHSMYRGKLQGALPVIPGHEAIGEIAAIGSGVSGFAVGQRVTIQPNFGCGDCPLCRAGRRNICPAKVRLGVDCNGVFADYVTAPANYVWPIPDGLSDEVAVLTEPLAVAAHGINQAPPRPGDRVLVFGAGVIGLLTLQLARLRGAEVTACDLADQRLALARQLGAARAINGKESFEPYANSYDVIYETSGAPGALAQSIQLAAPAGRIALLGLAAQEHPVPATPIVRKELQIVGSMIYTDEFPETLEILSSGRLQTEPLISGRLGLADLERGLQDFSAPTRVKMLVEL